MGKSKRSRKSKALPKRANLEGDKSFTDFLCPICLEILIEPVQMPCQHELCMGCFKKHVQDTSLTCPMCRLRISVWTRMNAKQNTLVNKERWDLIQALFPERVKRRLQGIDDIVEDTYQAPKHVLAADGEVGKEFQDQMKKIQEEEEAGSQASLDYIKQIQEEEFLERQRIEELDRVAAQELQKEEMANLGVTLKSPSQHQRELLALLKPKSPMKLRQRVVPNSKSNNTSSSSKTNSKAQRNILTSPNHTITNFFKKVENEAQRKCRVIVEKNVNAETITSATKLCSVLDTSSLDLSQDHELTISTNNNETSSLDLSKDYELAKSLQNDFNKELNQSRGKQPLRTLNRINVGPIKQVNPLIAKRKILHQDETPSKVKRKT